MANFAEAYKRLSVKEGGYVNDSDDAGGETYKGISRRYNPNWDGWIMIDVYKKRYKGNTLRKKLDADTQLQKLVERKYKIGYWDVFELDSVPNQLIAFQMFDTNVNCGQYAAIKFAEKALGRKITGRWSLSLLDELVKIDD